jgi:hypothetical protein
MCGMMIWPICAKSALVGLADILGRIEERLTALGLSATGATRLAGKPDAIRNIRRDLWRPSCKRHRNGF